MTDKKTDDLISINDAIKTGITRLRLDHWANPEDHIEIYITDFKGEPRSGPWVKLWSPTLEPLGMENPHEIFITEFNCDEKCWRPYDQGSSQSAI